LAHDPHHDAKRPWKSEPGLAGSHETALKNFLSVSELALDREMAATHILGPFRLDAETDTLFSRNYELAEEGDESAGRWWALPWRRVLRAGSFTRYPGQRIRCGI